MATCLALLGSRAFAPPWAQADFLPEVVNPRVLAVLHTSCRFPLPMCVRFNDRPAYRCRRRCFMPTGRYHLHDALQSHRLPFWFGLAGSISDTVRCRRGQLYLGMPDTYPCRAARLSRWCVGNKSNRSPLSQGCGLRPHRVAANTCRFFRSLQTSTPSLKRRRPRRLLSYRIPSLLSSLA